MQITRLLTEHPEMFLQEGARRNLLWFAQYMDPNFDPTPFHVAYYRVLDKFAKRQIKKLIIQAPPQHGKSQGSSRFLPADMLGFFPVFPDTQLNGSNVVTVANNYLRNSDVFEIVGHTGSLRVVGRGGSLTSKTVDVMIYDDLYKDSAEANSPIIRTAAWEWFTKVAQTRLHNDSQQLVVFTRWHPEDIIGKIIETEKVVFAEKWSDLENIPSGAWVLVNFEAIKTGNATEIDNREPGQPLWANRHSLERLLQQKQLDPLGFQCLYQGNPGDSTAFLYQPFKTWVDKKDWGQYVRSGCYVDVADQGELSLRCQA